MDTKECRTCKKVLPVTEFWIVRNNKATGTITRRADCRDCIQGGDKQDKKHTAAKVSDSNVKFDLDNPIQKVPTNYKNVSPIDMLNILKNKSNRVQTIYNVDTDLRKKILDFSKENNINISDAVNYIFFDYFKQ
jgi:hypothetical protein